MHTRIICMSACLYDYVCLQVYIVWVHSSFDLFGKHLLNIYRILVFGKALKMRFKPSLHETQSGVEEMKAGHDNIYW